MNDGSVKVDENKPDKRIEVVQSDQTPLPLDRLDRDQKVILSTKEGLQMGVLESGRARRPGTV